MSDAPVSLAVLPFASQSADDKSAYFATGFTEDLVACLTRFRPIRVIAAESSFRIAGLEAPLEQVALDWGLDAVLEGSVRRSSDQLRVTVRLMTVVGRETVWSEQFDAPVCEVFAVQDAIAGAVAGKLAVELDRYQRVKGWRTGETDPDVYDRWLEGMSCLNRATLEGDAESREHFREAIEIDERFARGHAGLSLSHFNEWTCQAWHLWDENEHNAYEHAKRAADLDESDAMVQAVLARVCRYRRQHDQADAHTARALELNPNDANVLIQASIAELFGGRHAEARRLAEKAIDHNPLHGPWYHGILGWAIFMNGNPGEALPKLLLGGDAIVNFSAYRAACHILLDDANSAQREYAQFEQQYRDKITFGRPPEVDEALRWAISVEPFREHRDSVKMPQVLKDSGLSGLDVEGASRESPRMTAAPANVVGRGENRFVYKDDLWQLEYEGTGAHLVELKGFHDIARLLSEPDVPIHCLELRGAVPESESVNEVLDAEARTAYRVRIEDLQSEMDEANSSNDLARLDRLTSERDAIVDELLRATGLGGRSRGLGDRTERARSAVTWRIRSSIKKIRAAHPRLGQHLSNSIKTGTFCVYAPESPVLWRL